MPLTERTERALEACHDAILAPTRWPSALQSLAESFGAASCMLYEHDRENSPAPVPMSEGHVGVCRSLDAQPGPCSRPARRTVPSKMQFIQKCGLGIRPGTRSLDRGRAPHNPFLSGDGATGEAGVACGVLFLGRRPQLVLAGLPRRRPVYARRRETPRQGRALSRENRQSGPKSLPRSTSPRNSRRWSESVPPPSSSTQRAAQGK